jgi:hypothetical protein
MASCGLCLLPYLFLFQIVPLFARLAIEIRKWTEIGENDDYGIIMLPGHQEDAAVRLPHRQTACVDHTAPDHPRRTTVDLLIDNIREWSETVSIIPALWKDTAVRLHRAHDENPNACETIDGGTIHVRRSIHLWKIDDEGALKIDPLEKGAEEVDVFAGEEREHVMKVHLWPLPHRLQPVVVVALLPGW